MSEDQMNAEIEKLRGDIGRLREDVSQLTRSLRDVSASRANHYRQAVEEELEERREQISKAVGAARDRGQRSLHELEQSVGDHPLGSIATAFGVGYLIAKLMDMGAKR